MEHLEIDGDHRDVGRAIGRRVGDQIHRLFDNYAFLQEHLLPFYHSPTGQDLYQAFLRLHQSHFPEYVAELEGIAQGSERPFDEVLLVNLRGEFGGLMTLEQGAHDIKQDTDRGCTDCLLLSPEAILIGHNEDGTPAAQDKMFVIRAHVDADSSFVALCYPGFLPGNAFGYNARGIVHTVDAVSPRQVKIGVGRHFLARSLLSANSLDDALKRVAPRNRASGFAYNVGSIAERKLVNVEVAPDHCHVHVVKSYYVHTNHYLNLPQVEQRISASSQARLARAQSMCRPLTLTDASQVLTLLGDEFDREYPIYRTTRPPDSSTTLCTGLFDLDSRQLRIFTGHPHRESDQYEAFDLNGF